MMRKEGLLGSVGIGAALAVVLGAVSILVKAGWAGFGQSRVPPIPEAVRPPQEVRAQPLPLPPDFEAQCRAAGI
jgi:hypothetical protein